RMPEAVEDNCIQARDVDDHAARRRIAPVAVAARTGDDPHRVTPRPADRALNIPQRLAEDDRTRLDRVEARVEEQARLGVAGAARWDDVAAQPVCKLLEDPRRGRRGELDEPSREGRRASNQRNAPATCE